MAIGPYVPSAAARSAAEPSHAVTAVRTLVSSRATPTDAGGEGERDGGGEGESEGGGEGESVGRDVSGPEGGADGEQ